MEMETKSSAAPNPSAVGSPVLGIALLALLGVLGIITLLFPGPKLLELENRLAASWQWPSLESTLDGAWAEDAEGFIKDRFPLRTCFISGNCFLEEAVLGKTEENGILIGRNGHMYTRRFSWSEEEQRQFQKNIEAVCTLGQTHPGLVTAMIVPPPSVIEPELLPAFAPQIDENGLFSQMADRLGERVSVLDLRESFTRQKEQQLFYRTDHHWTAAGALLAYEAYCQHMGLQPVIPEKDSAVEIFPFLGTHYASTRLWNKQPDTLVYYPSETTMRIYEVAGELEMTAGDSQPLVNEEKLNAYDKYGAFLDGNHGFIRIQGRGTGKLLVVKDSYGNCFVPYLVENYDQIDVVDYRSYPYGVASLQEEFGYDHILILYCFQSFVSDTRVVFINRPSIRQ